MKSSKLKKIKKSSGLSLIELMLVLILSSLITLALMQNSKREVEFKKAESESERMKILAGGLAKYMQDCFVTFNATGNVDTTKSLAYATANIPASNCAATFDSTNGVFSVTMANLKTNGYVPQEFLDQTLFDKDVVGASNGYNIYVSRTPVFTSLATKPDDESIQLQGVIVTKKPWIEGSGANQTISQRAWEVVKSGGGQFGVYTNTGSLVTGTGSATEITGNNWVVPFPLNVTTYKFNLPTTEVAAASLLPGKLIYKTLMAYNIDGKYVRLDGSNHMTGNLCVDSDASATIGNVKTCYDSDTNILNNIHTNPEYLNKSGNKDVNAVNWVRANGVIFRGDNIGGALTATNKSNEVSNMIIGTDLNTPLVSSIRFNSESKAACTGVGTPWKHCTGAGATIPQSVYGVSNNTTRVFPQLNFDLLFSRNSILTPKFNGAAGATAISASCTGAVGEVCLSNGGSVANVADSVCTGPSAPRPDCASLGMRKVVVKRVGGAAPIAPATSNTAEYCLGPNNPTADCHAANYKVLQLTQDANCTTLSNPNPFCVWSGVRVSISKMGLMDENSVIFGNFAVPAAGDVVRGNRKYENFLDTTSTATSTNVFNSNGSDKNGLVYARDILLEDLRGTVTERQGWVSDRLPRYVSKGVFSPTIPTGVIDYRCINGSNLATCPLVAKPNCPINAKPKVVVVPQIAAVQGKILGYLDIRGYLNFYLSTAGRKPVGWTTPPLGNIRDDGCRDAAVASGTGTTCSYSNNGVVSMSSFLNGYLDLYLEFYDRTRLSPNIYQHAIGSVVNYAVEVDAAGNPMAAVKNYWAIISGTVDYEIDGSGNHYNGATKVLAHTFCDFGE